MAATELPAAPGKTNSDSTSDDPALAILTDLAATVDAVGALIANLTWLHGTDGTKAGARSNLELKAQALDDGANIQKQLYTYWPDTGAADAYVITPTPAVTGHTPSSAGTKWSFKIGNANLTASPLLTVGAASAKPLKGPANSSLWPGALGANQIIEVTKVYTGSDYYYEVTSNLAIAGAGNVVQKAYAETATPVSITSTFPGDGTIPQIDEGTELLSVTVPAPKSAANKIRISAQLGFLASGAMTIATALFRSDDTDAQQVKANSVGGAYQGSLDLLIEFAAGTTSSFDVSIRAAKSGGTASSPTNVAFGGMKNIILVEEIQA